MLAPTATALPKKPHAGLTHSPLKLEDVRRSSAGLAQPGSCRPQNATAATRYPSSVACCRSFAWLAVRAPR